jgi:hypothetical protein
MDIQANWMGPITLVVFVAITRNDDIIAVAYYCTWLKTLILYACASICYVVIYTVLKYYLIDVVLYSYI